MREEGDRDDINDRPVFSVTGDMGGMHTNHQESSQMMSFCYTLTLHIIYAVYDLIQLLQTDFYVHAVNS